MNAAYLFLAFFLLCIVAALAEGVRDACPHCGALDGEHYQHCEFNHQAWRSAIQADDEAAIHRLTESVREAMRKLEGGALGRREGKP